MIVILGKVFEFPKWNRRDQSKIDSVLGIMDAFLTENGYQFENETVKLIEFPNPIIKYKIDFLDLMENDFGFVKSLSNSVNGLSLCPLTDGKLEMLIELK